MIVVPYGVFDVEFLPTMLEQERGHIVVISSLQGKIGIPNRSSCTKVMQILINQTNSWLYACIQAMLVGAYLFFLHK